MDKAKAETYKRYLVGLLAVIFVGVGYFRFFHGSRQVPPPAAAAQLDTRLEIPLALPPDTPPDKSAPRPAEIMRPRTVRDIFAPADGVPGTRGVDPAPEAAPPPDFTLKGTIVAGRHPIAVINGRFVRVGDRIDGYRVSRIDKNKVWLTQGSHRMWVETMSHE